VTRKKLPDTPDESITPPLSLQEVAALFGRTPRTIRNWTKAGLLTPLPLPRGPYFDPAQIRALCELPPIAPHGTAERRQSGARATGIAVEAPTPCPHAPSRRASATKQPPQS
jgi:hypothetical protein